MLRTARLEFFRGLWVCTWVSVIWPWGGEGRETVVWSLRGDRRGRGEVQALDRLVCK